jgi:hypothetical protein
MWLSDKCNKALSTLTTYLNCKLHRSDAPAPIMMLEVAELSLAVGLARVEPVP